MKRNPSIEAYRCLLMYGICLLHSLHRAGFGAWADHALMPCVCGFAVISGWFGVRFAPSKILRLYGVQIWCGTVIMLLRWAFEGVVPSFGWFREYMFSFWFVHAYALMMLLAPLVDCAVEAKRPALLPFFWAVFAWGWGHNFPVMNRFVPKTAGLDQFGALALLGAYALARLVRVSGVHVRFARIHCLAVFACASIVCSVLHVGTYNSLVAFLAAMSLFLVFEKTKSGTLLSRGGGGIVNFLSPSMFAIYFLHLNPEGLGLMETVYSKVTVFAPAMLAHAFGAAVAFVVCMMLDIPRRGLLKLCSRLAGETLKKLDALYASLSGRFEKTFAGD